MFDDSTSLIEVKYIYKYPLVMYVQVNQHTNTKKVSWLWNSCQMKWKLKILQNPAPKCSS
jgi:hypothetical protein